MTTSNQLLRFAITRPPVARGDFKHMIVGPFSREPGTEFQQEIARSSDPAPIAERYMGSDTYVGASLRHEERTRTVLRALPDLLELVREDDPAALLAALGDLSQRWRKGGQAADAIDATLWNSLIAAVMAPARPAQDVCDLNDALRIHSAISRASATAANPAAVAAALTGIPVLPPWLFPIPVPGSPADRGIRPAGVTDLLLIEEELEGYELEQLSYVSNVLRGEKNERSFRRLDRTNDSYTLSTENVEQSDRDLQSTSRSDMQTEVSTTASQESSISTGVSISASYGPFVSADTSINASLGTSAETATSMSESYAQDIVDRSVTRVSKSVRETAVQRVLAETEETSLHGFDNVAGAADVVGYYRWLQQAWRAQIMNYGRRMLIEFWVPKPAALWLAARGAAVAATFTDQPPAPLDLEPSDLDENTYGEWVVTYQVAGVSPPPAETLHISKTIELPELEHKTKLDNKDFVVQVKHDFVDVPPGYTAGYVYSDHSKQKWDTGEEQLRVHVGEQILDEANGPENSELAGITERVDIAVFMYDFKAATIDLRLRCDRTPEAMAAWQLATFEKIAAAHQALVQVFDAERDAHAAAMEQSINAARAVQASLSPDAKRKIELDELKRGAINILTNRDFSSFNAVAPPAAIGELPVINTAAALAEADQVRMPEQGFEWLNAVYVLYPYFWANQPEWFATLAETDPDPTFQAFLQAGYARLQVPVRPGFERAVLYYLGTGDLWHDGEPPVIGDELYVQIVEEVAAATGMSLSDAVPYGKPWRYKLPTTLVALDADVSDIGL